MIRIQFPDLEMKKRAMGFFLGRFSFKSWSTGEMLIDEDALAALAHEGIRFSVEGPATYEQIIQAVRVPTSTAV